MKITIDVDDASGAFAISLGKFVSDIYTAALKSGHPVGSAEYVALLNAAISDLLPALQNISVAVDAIKASPVQFGVALASQLEALV